MSARAAETAEQLLSHDDAMNMIRGAAGEATLSYEEAVAVYLRARGFLSDGAECLGDPVPRNWTPAFAASPATGERVTVKMVEWRQMARSFVASTPFGEYMAEHYEERDGEGWSAMLLDEVREPEDFATADEAKAACQADYERRIFSALSAPTPAAPALADVITEAVSDVLKRPEGLRGPFIIKDADLAAAPADGLVDTESEAVPLQQYGQRTVDDGSRSDDPTLRVGSAPSPAPEAAVTYPAELTGPLHAVLSTMLWNSGAIARCLRAGGEDIKPRAEDEQAHVLHWLIGLALRHGPDWHRAAGERIRAIRDLEKEGE